MTREPKVGDKVKVTASRSRLIDVAAECIQDDVGEITAHNVNATTFGLSTPWRVATPHGCARWLARSDFTLLDEEPAEPAPVFGVGDRVVVSEADSRLSGRAGKVDAVDDSAAFPIGVKLDQGGYRWFRPNELLAEPAQPHTVSFDDLQVGRRYRPSFGREFLVESDRGDAVWVRFPDGTDGAVYRSDLIGPFTPLDPEPPPEPSKPEEPVRTKVETLDLMKHCLEQALWLDKEVATDDGWCLTQGEAEILSASWRALYEKLKESL